MMDGAHAAPIVPADGASSVALRKHVMDAQAIAAIGAASVLAISLVAVLWNPVRRRLQAAENRRAIRSFRLHREQLEAKFADLAASQGKPRGLRWLDCDWQHTVTFGRDRQSGLLTAFVAVNVSFEAIEGGEMQDVDIKAVSAIREAAALFHYRRGVWGTGGRALFNMDPRGALVRLADQYEPVHIEGAAGEEHRLARRGE